MLDGSPIIPPKKGVKRDAPDEVRWKPEMQKKNWFVFEENLWIGRRKSIEALKHWGWINFFTFYSVKVRGKPFWSIHSIINWSCTIPNVSYTEILSGQAESSARKSLWMMWDQELMRRLQKLQTRSLKSQERWKGPIWSEAVIILSFQVWVKLVASGDLVEINLDRDKPARWLARSLKNYETQMIWYPVILTSLAPECGTWGDHTCVHQPDECR